MVHGRRAVVPARGLLLPPALLLRRRVLTRRAQGERGPPSRLPACSREVGCRLTAPLLLLLPLAQVFDGSDKELSKPLGEVAKVWPGLIAAGFSDASSYTVAFPPGQVRGG